MGFSRQEYWSGLPFPSPGDLPDPGIKPESPVSLPGKPFLTRFLNHKLEFSLQNFKEENDLSMYKITIFHFNMKKRMINYMSVNIFKFCLSRLCLVLVAGVGFSWCGQGCGMVLAGVVFVAANRGSSLLQATGFSLLWFLFGDFGLSSCGTQAQVLCAMWGLPGPEIEPVSPGLAGGFFFF